MKLTKSSILIIAGIVFGIAFSQFIPNILAQEEQMIGEYSMVPDRNPNTGQVWILSHNRAGAIKICRLVSNSIVCSQWTGLGP